jgi:preprotein translocase subunit SecF
LALFLFGGEIIRSFTAAMIWGVVIGTYSTTFVGCACADLPETASHGGELEAR